MYIIRWFEEITTEDRPLVGSKAFNLALLAQAHFPVSPAFCITTAAYQDLIAKDALQPAIHALSSLPHAQVEAAAQELQQRIRAAHLSAPTREAILSAYHKLATRAGQKTLPVAVRSSASTEDLPSASFAGQQATFLNVRNEAQLLSAILECWASLWSPQAILYRAKSGSAQRNPMMAVLVQQMVEADSAGVAFSIHPVTGEERVLIEAAFGQGVTVVSGRGDVDRYVIDRKSLAEVEPPVIAQKLHKQMMAVRGGLQQTAVPAPDRNKRVLTPEQVKQVAETVLALEQLFGSPQDMEWAFAQGQLYVLQSRPITTSPRSFFTDVIPGDDHVWTSGFLNERFPLPVSPLGWSMINELLEKLAFRDPLRYLGLKGVEQLHLTKLYRGHPYVNLFVFQTIYKVFPDFLLPEDAYRYFPSGKTELRHLVKYPRSLFDPRFLFSMLWHFLHQPTVWSPWHHCRTWATFATQHEKRSQQLEEQYEALRNVSSTVASVWAAIEQAQQLNAELLSLHRWSLICADLTYTLLRRLARAWVSREDALELCSTLITGLPNKTLEIDQALQDLARVEDADAFDQALASFLRRYGHRSFYLDVYHPPFAAQPAQVIDLIQRLKHKSGTRNEKQPIRPEQARRILFQSFVHSPLTWLKRRIFAHVLFLSCCYLPLREDQRFYWQRTLALMRKLFLLLGSRMAKAGALDSDIQIFFLTKAEVEAYVRNPAGCAGLATLAKTRQQQFERLCKEFEVAPAQSYPPFLRGNQPLSIETGGRDRQFHGQAVSPGLAKGPVVVLLSPSEFNKVKPGDVLVARGVDPGWTPIFSLLSAMVIEYGGQLSHASVVAREYGLPAVAGIPGITQLLRDGDMVIVDGLNGIVTKEPTRLTSQTPHI
ncbi:MAG: PEP/pyruvate-binding domain-containing protein [Anaerolineae bacterium]